MSPPHDHGPNRPWNVLLVEDCLHIQRLVTLILKRAGASVECIDDGEAALARVLMEASRNEPFDLILLDLCLPSMGGLEILRALRRQKYRGRIAMLTACTTEVEACFEAGCDEYITKPLDRATFVPRCLSLIGLGSARVA